MEKDPAGCHIAGPDHRRNLAVCQLPEFRGPAWCPFGCGQSFNVDFGNKTSDCIIFPSDYGLRVYVSQFGIWRPTEFGLKHLNFGSNHSPVSDSLKLNPNKGDGWLMSIASTVFPGNTIRVVLQGTTCSHGATSGENFADYADLKITTDNLRGP